jgi:serine/threonine-protein kinase PRP4
MIRICALNVLQGKGEGLPIVRSGLHDNWDDPVGYYSKYSEM